MNDKHILKFLNKGIRIDGRKIEQYRKITVERGIMKTAEGSSRVKIGDTEVIAGVKLGIEKPFPDTPDKGGLVVNAELLALASPEFELGPPGIKAIELSRVVDRGIRESEAIDFKKLCIEEGEKAWFISVDICAINDAGNLFDAAGLAALSALKNASFPEYDGKKIDYKKKTKEHLPLKSDPVPVTVIKIKDKFIVDPTIEEEKALDARLTAAVLKDDTLCALQKGGDEPITVSEVGSMVDIAIKHSKELRKLL